VVTNLVGGIAEHQNDLFAAFGNAAQANGKSVAAENRENNTHSFTAQLSADVLGDGIHGGIVALGTGDYGLCNCNHISVAQSKTFAVGSLQDTVHHNGSQVIALADDGAADAAGSSANSSFHNVTSFLRRGGRKDCVKGNSRKLLLVVFFENHHKILSPFFMKKAIGKHNKSDKI
jgi:hypothetical protein